MPPILFIFVGRTKEGFIKEGLDKYAGLIGRLHPVEVREIKGAAGREPEQAKDIEGEAILSRVAAGDCLIALDERGRNPRSVDFAKELDRLLGSGRRTVFVTGGPFGLSGKVRERADMLLSLSKLTFTHEMARLVLLEQVYRAMTITRGMTYHY